jgi:hypothetical protein
MNRENIKELRVKILKGIELSYDRLLISKQKDDAKLVFSRNGQIVKVKARELKNKNALATTGIKYWWCIG